MPNKKIIFLLLFCIAYSVQSIAQTFTLSGTTFDERCESLINCMVNDIEPYSGSVNIKYTSPFYWARIYKGIDAERAEEQLKALYAVVAANPESVTGSDIEFFAHHTMHGYLLCKDKISGNLIRDIKKFLQGIDFNKIGSVSTLNLDMMRYTAGLMAAQEWPEFTDKNNKNAIQITAYNRARVLKTLDNIYHNNCKEMDATIYLPTNTMYIRMLAEFSTDPEIRQKAYVVYQQIIAAMTGAWNKGLYIGCPPRAKGWDHLITGIYGTNSRITALAWLYFGNTTNEMKMANQYLSDTNNYGTFCFWTAYHRNIRPMQEILNAEARKTFPYEYVSYIDDKSVTAGNTIKNNWHYYKYTWQSENFGLATQTEIPYSLSSALSLYTYKETKRTYLAWHSDQESSQCYFSVCQDNPERPTDAVNPNGIGYGENPYHRVLQHKNAAIGITNVPTSYLNGNRYQLYVPFTRIGIKLRIEADSWVLCHTGSMMFAFKTIEPFTVLTGRMPYNVPNCDLLMFTDQTTRKGSWILQATEITADLQGATLEEELEKFRVKLLVNTNISTINYSSNTPQLQFTSIDGDLLDLTFFPPNEAYNGQYRINGIVKQALGDGNLFNSPYARQAHGSDNVYIYNTGGNPVVLNWNDQIPDSLTGTYNPAFDKTITFKLTGNLLHIQNIYADGKADIYFYNETGNIVRQTRTEINNNQCTVHVDSLSSAVYIVRIHATNKYNRAIKWIKTS